MEPTSPELRVCIDRIIPSDERKIAAAAHAIAENRANAPALPPLSGISAHPLKLALMTGKRWAKGRALDVHFLDGSAKQQEKVKTNASHWMNFANIKLNFGAKAQAQIRISFVADPGSWSAVGTDCLLTDAFPANSATMNFGWLKDETDDVEYRRVVTHEFGHALGAIHEHQNPRGGIVWNLPAVYAYFSGPPNNWTKAEIDHNVVQKYSVDQLNATTFDPASIMLYSFPKELLASGHATANNTDLSAGDKTFIKTMYPA